jgi:hypothetical protein
VTSPGAARRSTHGRLTALSAEVGYRCGWPGELAARCGFLEGGRYGEEYATLPAIPVMATSPGGEDRFAGAARAAVGRPLRLPLLLTTEGRLAPGPHRTVWRWNDMRDRRRNRKAPLEQFLAGWLRRGNFAPKTRTWSRAVFVGFVGWGRQRDAEGIPGELDPQLVRRWQFEPELEGRSSTPFAGIWQR